MGRDTSTGRRLVLGAGLVCCLALAPRVARADEPSPALLAGARDLFREATDDADAGRFDVALEKLGRVVQIRETSAVRFNIARCEESLGRLGSALADYELALALSLHEHDAEIAVMARGRAESVRPRAPRVVLVLPEDAPPSTELRIDGRRVVADVLLPTDPGRHAVDVTAPGFAPYLSDFDAREGETARVVITLEALGPPPPTKHLPPPPPPPDVRDPGISRTQIWGLGLGGAGVVLGTGALAFVVVHNTAVSELQSACTPLCPAARRGELEEQRRAAVNQETVAWVLGGAALAAAGVGAVLFFYSPRRGVQVNPAAGPTGAALRLTGAF